MAKKRKYPEFELPKIFIDSVAEYLGPRAINKLTQMQRQEIHDKAQTAAREISKIMDRGTSHNVSRHKGKEDDSPHS